MTDPLDEAIRALTSHERRQPLTALTEHDPHQYESFDDLDGLYFESVENKEKLHIGLHHHHLPRLEAAGLIEWHHADREISKGPKFGEIRPILRILDSETRHPEVTNDL